MTTEIIIDQQVLQSEIDLKRQFKAELEAEVEGLKSEASLLKKRQDVLTLATEGMKSGIDLTIINDEIKSLNDEIWRILETLNKRNNAIEHYERLLERLEELKNV